MFFSHAKIYSHGILGLYGTADLRESLGPCGSLNLIVVRIACKRGPALSVHYLLIPLPSKCIVPSEGVLPRHH